MKAKVAFVDDHFELAVDLYSQAISLNPKDPNRFADRAQANIKLHNFTEVVTDANRAIELDPKMYKAYLRKGTACIKLEEYQTAKAAFEIGASLALGDSRFISLIKECDEHIAEYSFPQADKVQEYLAFWSLINGIETPENMPRCINNCHNLEILACFLQQMACQVHVHSSWWLSKKTAQHMGHLHICVWHDLEWKLLSWAWLTCLFFIPEMIVKSTANTLQQFWYIDGCPVQKFEEIGTLMSSRGGFGLWNFWDLDLVWSCTA